MPRAANMKEDEALAQEVEKYPCIYDKSDLGHKEKDRVNNAWTEIEKSLELEEGNAFDLCKAYSGSIFVFFFKGNVINYYD